jgi:hypothetical protein
MKRVVTLSQTIACIVCTAVGYAFGESFQPVYDVKEVLVFGLGSLFGSGFLFFVWGKDVKDS